MNTLIRNIGIRLRHKTYVFAQSFAAENHLTTSDFIKSLMLLDCDFLVGLAERKAKAFNVVDDVKIAGRILNIHAKQINSNIENRNPIDDGFYNDLFSVIDRAISAYKSLRFFDHDTMINNLSLQPSNNFMYKKKAGLKRRTWQFFKLNLSDNDYQSIVIMLEHYQTMMPDLTLNKYANLVLGVFQNQNGFDAKFTSMIIKNLVRQFKYIRVNANQIFNDVRQNARVGELQIAQKINERMKYLIDDLNDDPALFSGRKFSYHYYVKRHLKARPKPIILTHEKVSNENH